MSDAPAFVVANFTIHDADEYRIYEKGFFPILKRHGGEFFTFDDSTIHLEGNELYFEPGLRKEILQYSDKFNLNEFKSLNLFFGGINAVSYEDCVSDIRRGGKCIIE